VAARFLGLRFRTLPSAWISAACGCYVWSGRGLCVGLITRPEESYRVCVSECEHEASKLRRPCPTTGCMKNTCLYSETNVMHFLFNLLRIKGLDMFRALLAHPQKELQIRNLVHCVRIMSVGFTRIEGPLQCWCSQLT
jgi:hypothetical protein